jgi:branched-chain amino acid transport system permease protein
MAATAIVLLDGLSYASTLFLMAAGLTLIFGVTRIVNFAHGSFFMLGALFSAHWLVNWFPHWADQASLYALAMLAGAACAGLVGALAECLLLRRLYGVPELYQLVATFGLSLFLHDGMRWLFGPDEVFAPRFAGLKGSVEIGGEFFPQYQLLLIALGPLVWLGLHLSLQHTRWGSRLRAATMDRDMLGALGVNPKPLMLIAVVLGCALAGLGGALQLPREPAHLQMDMNSVVETFVVVVTGGLGSISGAFLAAILIGLVHSFGTALFPQATQVLVFVTMGLVLAVRPRGLMGKAMTTLAHEHGLRFQLWPVSARAFQWACMALALVFSAFVWQGEYWQSLLGDVLVLVIVGVSLQSMMALGALVSFGHAAFFGLGAYAAAWVHLNWGWSLLPALLAASTASLVFAALVGGLLVRSSGVYLAMLSLAAAQVLWAGASQWGALIAPAL